VISTGRKFGPHPEKKSSQNNEEKVVSKLANKISVPAKKKEGPPTDVVV